MPATGQRETRRSEARRKALLSVCASQRKKSVETCAHAMTKHWIAQSAKWEAEAAAATAREAATAHVAASLSQQNRELARKLSQAESHLALLRGVYGLRLPHEERGPPRKPPHTARAPALQSVPETTPDP